MKLSELKDGQKGIIVKTSGRGAFRKRITEMGFVRGKEVLVIKNAPLKDPIEYSILGYQISLRRAESELIEVVSDAEIDQIPKQEYNGFTSEEIIRTVARKRSKEIRVALVGNPNCGKTTFFNFASNSQEHVGNYSGVTVDAKVAKFKYKDYTIKLTDLPGTYSLTAYSPEELYVRRHIFEQHPDVVINVIDSSNLERNLYLTTQLIDMDVRVVIALNMYDELQTKGDKFDHRALGDMLGIPMVPTVSSKSKGINEVFDAVIQSYENQQRSVRRIKINYGQMVENAIAKLSEAIDIEANRILTARISPRFLALKLLEQDEDVIQACSELQNWEILKISAAEATTQIENNAKEDAETLITDAKYGFISGALKETYREGGLTRRRKTDMIDTIITHRLWGFPIFFFFIWLMFQSTFSLGEYPMQWIDALVEFTGSQIDTHMADGMLKDLLVDGIVGGVGGVIVFLPNILILFFFISLLEDTGYMARAAFIMDKIMHKIGLHGKSFIPLIMGFGCNVPAIMSTRTLENRSERLLTILILPFMSCSARLPVYLLIIGTFFTSNQGSMLFLIYALGILLAAGVALIFKRLFFKEYEAPFVMELPPYRIPTLKTVSRHMWQKGREYLKKMGGIILIASVLIWALGYFPRINSADYENLSSNELQSIQQENSYIGQIGHSIEPIMEPLGFDWKMSIGLLSGVVAKEIVVSTMGVLYQSEDEATIGNDNLGSKLKNERYQYGPRKGEPVFSKIAAFSFLLFILIYFPCIAVIAAIKREAGHWKWAVFTIFYTTGLAWLISFMFYQTASLFV